MGKGCQARSVVIGFSQRVEFGKRDSSELNDSLFGCELFETLKTEDEVMSSFFSTVVKVVSVISVMFFMANPEVSAEGLPRTFGWTAYGTTSAGYAVSVAIGNALADEGYRLRVIPGKNDISRMTPLRAGRVHFSAMGIGSYLAQEGVNEFGARRWGPQPVRLIMMSWSDVNIGLPVVARDSGVETAYDLIGKRVAWVVGGPALNMNMTGYLAFGNLTWDDVVRMEVSGWKASIQGMIDGTIDAAIASTNSSMLYQLEGSPRGMRFIPAPHEDAAGWGRMSSITPWILPHIATAGVGLSPDNVLEGGSYGYPILITYSDRDEEMAYDLARLLHVNFDKYKNAHSSGLGFAIERQVFDWIVPYHSGAIRYFKEIGVWSDDYDVHNRLLVERQMVLKDAWESIHESEKAGGAFEDIWLAARNAALSAAGMDTVW